MAFVSTIDYKILVRGELWQLTAPLIYRGHGLHVIIPAGYVTDFYSIPALFQGVWPKDILPVAPSVLHDYIFSHMQKVFTLEQANKIFLMAMRESGVPWLRRRLFYRAVCVGGRPLWEVRKKKREKLLVELAMKSFTVSAKQQ